MKEQQRANHRGVRTIVGKLTGKRITLPDVNVPPMPVLAPPGVVHNGRKAENFGEIDLSGGYPDVRSFRRKVWLIIPATNTSMDLCYQENVQFLQRLVFHHEPLERRQATIT